MLTLLFREDVGSNAQNTNNHPANVWQQGKDPLWVANNGTSLGCRPFHADAVIAEINLPTVESDTSLFRAGAWYAQNAGSENLQGWNISLAAEKSVIVPTLFPTLDAKLCMSSSKLDGAAIPAKGPPDTIYIVCQTRGDDITIYTSIPNSKSWSKFDLNITNE